MAGGLSQAQLIGQFVCGIPKQGREQQAHFMDTRIGFVL